ncbi:MAG: DUF5011 domain-containing protein [Candidatus Paceibacterota bacterium]|jgi:hypothetical protein
MTATDPVGPVSFDVNYVDQTGYGTINSTTDGSGVNFSLTPPVPDTVPPVITLVGPSSVDVLLNSNYVDAGATAFDNVDGNLTANLGESDNVDTSTIGTYTVTYTVSDSSGNAAIPVSRTVNVVSTVPSADVTPPVITLLGTTPVDSLVGTPYFDAGATALDNVDGNITANIVTTNLVDPNTIGQYIVSYNVSDATGNAAIPVTRTVNVVAATTTPPIATTTPDTTPPVITLLGVSLINITMGTTYTDAGATALDSVDGVRPVTVSGSVNTGAVGTYQLIYQASDISGNLASSTRTVNVVAIIPPAGGGGGSNPGRGGGGSSTASGGSTFPSNGNKDLPKIERVLGASVFRFGHSILKMGDQNGDVKALQLFLIDQNSGSIAKQLAKVGATGYFGPMTSRALIEYQRKVGVGPYLGRLFPKLARYISNKISLNQT